MFWVILLVVLALVFGGVGLLVDALQVLLIVGAVLLVLAIFAGFRVKSKAKRAFDKTR